MRENEIRNELKIKLLEYIERGREIRQICAYDGWLVTFIGRDPYKEWLISTKNFLKNNFYQCDELRKYQEISEIAYSNSRSYLDQLIGILSYFHKNIDTIELNLKESKKKKMKKIFIVHGHDIKLLEKVERLLYHNHIEPIILQNRARAGMIPIIEAFETAVNEATAAIVLLTPDDIGGEKKEDLRTRARQNVIFEAGYVAGKLGRNNVILLNDSVEELPSDLHGVLYTNTEDWKYNLITTLREMGYC